MPSYKTHAIHGSKVFPNIDLKTNVNIEDVKAFSIGPDLLIATNPLVFKLQHMFDTRLYFLTLIYLIKQKKLYDNPEVMSYLYGQLNHFVLDIVTHPLIYYMTEDLPKEHVLDAHGLVEHYIDDYMMEKLNIPNGPYLHKICINNIELLRLINELYQKVYRKSNLGIEYSLGIGATRLYDLALRRDKTKIFDFIGEQINLGDVKYHGNSDLAKPYLNLSGELWLDPETGDIHYETFDELWKKAIEMAEETINDVNMTIYNDKPLNNALILNDISYNTGLPCDKGQNKTYIKSYSSNKE